MVPYGAIKRDTRSFIANEYLPEGVILEDPRNMRLEVIQKILRHCYDRQAESGPTNAFRFAMYIGKHKKKLFANYEGTSNDQGRAEQVPKKKGKGKQRDDQGESEEFPTGKGRKKNEGRGKRQADPLDGLLQIEPRAPTPIPTADLVAGPFYSNLNPMAPEPESSHLVRIGMGEMAELKKLGYGVSGPINGPDEGLPQYEVPRAWLEHLARSQIPIPTGFPIIDPALLEADLPTAPRPYPKPRLLQTAEASQSVLRPEIEVSSSVSVGPLLDHQTPNPESSPSLGQELPPENIAEPVTDPESTQIRPTTPLNVPSTTAEPEPLPPKTPKKSLGKRPQANLSPNMIRETQGKKKRKKVTNDDLAALEAQEMMQSGSRKRKATKRH